MFQNSELPSALRSRPFAEVPELAQRATDLLRTPRALMNLSPADAACVVEHMRLLSFAAGVTLFREGDEANPGHLLLLLEGDVSIDASANGLAGPVAISVVGPGSVIGEMALLDGAPRSASCLTVTPVQAAGLSRKGLETLINQHPKVAAVLLVGLSTRIAERLRALGDQLQIYAKLCGDLQAEVQRLRRTPR